MQHPETHDITALAYGLIEGPEREALLTHLSECDDCRAVYDSYREEQASVRDAIVRDARSGAAEASALESTLRMLGGLDSVKPRGRLLRLPRWVLVAEVAAVLAVAVGLFFILRPDTEPEFVPIAEELRAPATVDGGVVYVSDRQGEWKPAEAVPEDEWVMAGGEHELALSLADGSRATIQPGGVFRIGRDADALLTVHILRGNGVIDSGDAGSKLFVRSGDAGFFAFPHARLSIVSEAAGDARVFRAWDMPGRVNAAVQSGNVVLWPESGGYGKLPLRIGDLVEWTPRDLKVTSSSGQTLPVHMDAEGGADAYTVAMRDIEPRLAEFRRQLEALPFAGNRRMLELRRHFLVPLEASDGRDTTTIVVTDGHSTRTVEVSTDGRTFRVAITDGDLRSSFEGSDLESLKPSVPGNIRKLLDDVNVERDADGNWRIRGADVKAGSGTKLIVRTTSTRD
jgi:hypothetical protein